VAFSPALVAMSAVWAAVDYQAHGFLVGPVAAAMAWSRRRRLRSVGSRPDGAGLALLTLALAAYAAGLLADLLSLQGVALPLALAGLAWWRRGRQAARALAFPIAYLLFLVPVPPQWLAPVVTGLQRFVTGTAMALLRVAQVPALREGNVIVVPEGSLFVAEACSGITSIVALLPVAALLVFLAPGRRRQALALLAAVVPVAMFWNLVRVLATVAATRSVGAVRATTGSLHETAGMLTFVMGCLTLLALSAWLGNRRRTP
jgi:exosortase